MKLTRTFAAAVVATVALSIACPAATQGPPAGDAHGELLYSTYCIGCHTTQMHWRDKKLATDWSSLLEQVRRWQRNVAPGLSEDDVAAIARHLNDRYYRLPVPGATQADSSGPPARVAARLP